MVNEDVELVADVREELEGSLVGSHQCAKDDAGHVGLNVRQDHRLFEHGVLPNLGRERPEEVLVGGRVSRKLNDLIGAQSVAP